MPPVPVQVQRVPTVIPIIPPVQVQRVRLKYSGGEIILARKTVRLILDTWRHDPHLYHTCSVALSQLVIQDYLNHIYHPVTGQRKNYDKIKLQHPNR